MYDFYTWLEGQVTLAQFEGEPSSEFQAANLMKDGKQVGRINFGLHNVMGRIYGSIDDVYLFDDARGTNAMRYIYPQIEERLANAGATYIKLNTVDAGLAKVWGPLGFEQSGKIGDTTKVWRKNLT
jgi:hypothetical protein